LIKKIFGGIIMFGFIKWLFRHRRDNDTLKDIKKAKDIYASGTAIGMCQSFCWANYDRYNSYEKILERIPEFKPETFNVDPELLDDFWWRLSDRDSRIKAFDKLIEIYS
jgi:hypothetical protein